MEIECGVDIYGYVEGDIVVADEWVIIYLCNRLSFRNL